MHLHLSRRTVLKGLGTAVALPLLEAMLPQSILGAAAKKMPLRMAFCYIPNGVNMYQWRVKGDGLDFELSPTLEPLQKVKDELIVFTGLKHQKAFANGDGPGDHARAMATFLTGCQAKKTAGADIKIGISVDQVAAQKVGKATKFASLELGCEGGKNAGNCDSGYSCAYSANLSWRGESTPMSKEVNPRLVFERLFTNGFNQSDAERVKQEMYRKSILDFVAEDATNLKRALGVTDQRKLDEYLVGVREIEQRLQKAEKEAQDGSDPAKTDYPRPRGVPRDYGEHLKLMADMLVLAFQADLTRIGTFVFANDGSNRAYKQVGVSDGHHDTSHHGGNKEKLERLQKINQFHIQHFAYLLERLKSIREGHGTLLDNCMIVYGAGISDGNRHNHNDLPVLLAGKGGGTLKTGRHITYTKEQPMTNLFLSMLDRMGAPVASLGDSTGRLSDLDRQDDPPHLERRRSRPATGRAV
jgi:Protein of unknown function (DUF1552)